MQVLQRLNIKCLQTVKIDFLQYGLFCLRQLIFFKFVYVFLSLENCHLWLTWSLQLKFLNWLHMYINKNDIILSFQ